MVLSDEFRTRLTAPANFIALQTKGCPSLLKIKMVGFGHINNFTTIHRRDYITYS